MVPARWRYAWKTSQKPTWSSTSDRRERMNKETIEALHQIEKEKGVSFEILIAALEDALHSAYKKTAGAVPFSEVHIDRESGELRVFELVFPEGEEPDLEAEEDEDTEVDYSLAERHEITPSDFGRIAAQTAKQVIYQRIREAEQDMFFEEYSDRIGDIVTGIVQQSDNRYTLVDLGRVEALLPKSEQVSTERYEHGMRVKAVIKEVSHIPKALRSFFPGGAMRWCIGSLSLRFRRWRMVLWRSGEWPGSLVIGPRYLSFHTVTVLIRSVRAWAREVPGFVWSYRSCEERR